MSKFIRKVERQEEFLECDVCGTRQNEFREPRMGPIVISETIEGSHGHDYTRQRELHICDNPCVDRLGQIILALQAKRDDSKRMTEKRKQLLKLLDELVSEA